MAANFECVNEREEFEVGGNVARDGQVVEGLNDTRDDLHRAERFVEPFLGEQAPVRDQNWPQDVVAGLDGTQDGNADQSQEPRGNKAETRSFSRSEHRPDIADDATMGADGTEDEQQGKNNTAVVQVDDDITMGDAEEPLQEPNWARDEDMERLLQMVDHFEDVAGATDFPADMLPHFCVWCGPKSPPLPAPKVGSGQASRQQGASASPTFESGSLKQFKRSEIIAMAYENVREFTPQLIKSSQFLKHGVAASERLHGPSLPSAPSRSSTTNDDRKVLVRVWSESTLDAARILAREYTNARVGVLNLADSKVPGGELFNGSTRQEEKICLQSTALASLHDRFYPLPDDCLIYSPDVFVYRDGDLNLIEPKGRFLVDVISCATVNRPNGNLPPHAVGDMYHHEHHRQLMKDKITWVMRAAAANKVDKLVLGALGCGVFRNPVPAVIQLFKEVLLADHGATEDWPAAGIQEIIIAVVDYDRRTVAQQFRDSFHNCSEEVEVDMNGLDSWVRSLASEARRIE